MLMLMVFTATLYDAYNSGGSPKMFTLTFDADLNGLYRTFLQWL